MRVLIEFFKVGFQSETKPIKLCRRETNMVGASPVPGSRSELGTRFIKVSTRTRCGRSGSKFPDLSKFVKSHRLHWFH